MRPQIVPSVLSADFANLARDVELIQRAGAQSVQIDVMDGHFVPNITVGPVVVEALRKHSSIYLDVHLMIENPERYLAAFAQAGANLLTVHWEACSDAAKVVRQIKKLGAQAGVALRPKTPETVLGSLLSELDLVLVMTVEPGFGGQAFMPDMLPKVRNLRAQLDRQQLPARLQVDGGINRQTAPRAAQAGATSLVAGSAIFGAPDPTQAFHDLQKLVDLPSGAQVQ
ncbi:MAG TPA: ribulose-phosphate 3-epimerase [Elusimicrobiota bacterium]|nr:ribulose-phosphate 3-epimerase [Elusimicrobiota bacterium]